MTNINIRELARQLKLSVSTVSKALHDSHEISDETKKRVLASAARLNYIPNPYASSLRGRRSKNIALVIPEVADSFFSLAINGIESVAKEKEYHVLIYLTHEIYRNEEAILAELRAGRVDGVLMSVSRETVQTDHVKSLIENGIPLVFFDRVCEEIDTARITTNDFAIACTATEHLIKQGCDKIIFLNVSRTLSITNRRFEGYKKALADHNIVLNEEDLVFCRTGADENYEIIKNALRMNPDGVIASVENLTAPFYKACSELKIKIPEDVKFLCFSNLEIASILHPSLTTVTQPAFEMGKVAATLLFKALEKTNFDLAKESLEIPSSLLIRDSTAANKIIPPV